MSNFTYFIVLYTLAVLCLGCAIWARRMKGELAKSVASIEMGGFFILSVGGAYMLIQDIQMAYLLRGMFAGLTDVTLRAFMVFIELYTMDFKRNKFIERSFNIFTIVDILSYAINVTTHHAFVLTPVDNHMGGDFYAISERYLWDYVHLTVFFFCVAMMFIALLYRSVNVSAYNRFKFVGILVGYSLVISSTIFWFNFHLTVDYSLLGYGILALAIFYLSLFFVPKGMKEQLMLLLNKDLDVGILCFDHRNKIAFMNKKVDEQFDIQSRTKKVEAYVEEWLLHNRDLESKQWRDSVDIYGEKKTYDINYKKLYDDENVFIGSYFSIIDRTRESEIAEEVKYKVTHDLLTDVYNREYYLKEVHRVLMEEPNEEFYLIVSDINDFKLVNDLFGVEQGNEVLVREADLIRKYSNENTVYGRIGADQFSVLVHKKVFSEALILDNVYRMGSQYTNNVYRMQIYVGVYEVIDHDEDVSVMCDKANMAIAELKGEFGRVISYYNKAMLEQTIREKRWISEFKYAIEEKQFCMYLQPQVTARGELLGAEALVRWMHPDVGMVSPSEFIPAFERSGIIKELDLYMWNEAGRKLREWKEMGRDDLYISVNISPKDFYYIDIYRTLTMMVDNYEINPNNLKLEITETAMMAESNTTIPLISRLQRFGFQVELDDFGSGYSSLNTLKDIRADVLKLDLNLVREVEKKERSREILASIIGLSERLGMSVVAEGIETKEQLEILDDMNCDFYQGYYFSKPLSVEQFEAKYFDN